MEYYERIRQRREDLGMTQSELAEALGYKSRSTIAKIEAGINDIVQSQIVAFAKVLKVSPAYLMGWESDNTQPVCLDREYGAIKIPVYGIIPAGQPLEAIEDIVGYEEISAKAAKGGKEFFALEIKGDSMYPEYHNKDVVIFVKQPDCESGQDCAVAINGDEWTFKRVEKIPDGIIIKPLNPAYETKFYSNKEVSDLPVEIKGVIWELRRSMRNKK